MYARRRRHWYFAMMGSCILLFVLAWAVVRLWSVPAAVAMCVVAMVIPPFAAIVGNRREPGDFWDDPADSWLEDEPADDSWIRDEEAARARAAGKRPDDGDFDDRAR
ncbi:DUF1275 domain-containing protein [Streptomyces sp. So13.3]|uniref:DUF3099 domain-containing protein n=1 Tax=Streptomyces TaxID=1883 RepID=UPI001106337C|nr:MULTISPECIES: DUF3099 domain-containing protein [Streptomyces]MCZ4099454.1 DUF3099 domain-containing protein [Streptomyces sp. H39-C1]QNA74560.1 DUF1275 domain-containing protein [Streptomyces sp. So13.3]